MAVSAAAYYEVRWRVKGNDEAWSAPRRVSPVSEVVIEELDRNTQYEFEVRAVSNCGAKSIWVPSDYTVPGAVPPTSIDTLTAQSLADGVHLGWTSIATPAAGIESSIERSANGTTGWAERARVRSTAYTDPETSGATYYYRVRYVNFAGQFGAYSPVASSNGVNVGSIGTNAANALADAAAAQADANAANAALADIASDNLLTAGEKPVVIRDYNVITTEQTGIDAQATAYGITTTKTAYDTAVSALTTYLGTLTAPVLWSNLTGNTTIVGATFRSKFADVYTTRQALLNAIYAAAKAKADAAQATADTGLGQVTQLPVINGGFDMAPTGYGWTPDSGSGWYTDTTGLTPGIGPNCGARAGISGGASSAYRNNGLASCNPGQVYKAQALIKASGANGSCYVYISWCAASGLEIDTTFGNAVTGTMTAGSYATGSAPAGTVYARTCLATIGHTTGYYAVDNVVCTQYPNNLDEVPDGSLFLRSSQQAGSALVVDNPGFEIGYDAAGNVPGWAPFNGAALTVTTAGPYVGASSLRVTGSTPAMGVQTTRKYACTPGDLIYAEAAIYSDTGNLATLQIRFYTAAGVAVSPAEASGTAYDVWQLISKTGTAPATATCFTLLVYNGGASGGAFSIDAVKLTRVLSIDSEVKDGATYARIKGTELTSGQHKLTIGGSGIRLGAQNNAPQSLVSAYGAVNTTSAITATSAGAVSINAFTIRYGSFSVSYSAVSNAVTGLAVSSTYAIYCIDTNFSGGVKTWFASTDTAAVMNLGDGVVVAGNITIPASGTGSGGGGGFCVTDDTILPGYDRADAVISGHSFVDVVDLDNGHVSRAHVEHAECIWAQCVRLTTRAGIEIECSTTAAFAVDGGQFMRAEDMQGALAAVMDFGVWGLDEVVEVMPIGRRRVVSMSCHNSYYLAGKRRGRYFAHHNRKMGL